MPDQPIEWRTLKCDCGSELFMLTGHLRWKLGGGLTTQPAGYKCCACGMDVDSGYLIKREEVAMKRREAQLAQEELANLEGQVQRPPMKAGGNPNVRV